MLDADNLTPGQPTSAATVLSAFGRSEGAEWTCTRCEEAGMVAEPSALRVALHKCTSDIKGLGQKSHRVPWLGTPYSEPAH